MTKTLATSRHARRPRTARRGYTAIEVMLSVAVLGIGAAGVMSMQRAAIQGNQDARMMDVANSIARQWIERIRRDGMGWTQPDEVVTTPNWGSTYIVSQLGTKATTAQGQFFNPIAPTTGPNSASVDGYGRAFDILGRDVPPSGSTFPGAVFCVQTRGDWVEPDQLLRVTVRVYWLRQLFTAPSGNFCSSDAPDTNTVSTYHMIYATTAVRRNPG